MKPKLTVSSRERLLSASLNEFSQAFSALFHLVHTFGSPTAAKDAVWLYDRLYNNRTETAGYFNIDLINMIMADQRCAIVRALRKARRGGADPSRLHIVSKYFYGGTL